MIHQSYDKQSHMAVLLHRILLSILFLFYAMPVLLEGPESWVLHAPSHIFEQRGVLSFYGFIELSMFTFGGLFLLLGLYTVPVCSLLAAVSVLNMVFQWTAGAPFFTDVALFSLFLISCVVVSVQGAGRHSLDYRFHLKRVRKQRIR